MKSVAKKNDAVSPVIGTILLVAITVVLVAIVAAVVMGMVGGVGETKSVGVIVTPFSNTSQHGVIVTVSGGSDSGKINGMNVYLDGTNLGAVSETIVVGKPYEFGTTTDAGKSVSGTVTVSAKFLDNTTQVIYTNTVGIPATVSTT
ncbi:type IV pilin [Methanorbis furvi]